MPVRPARERAEAAAPQRLALVHRPTEQAHVVLGIRAIPSLDPDRDALSVVNQEWVLPRFAVLWVRATTSCMAALTPTSIS